MLEGHIIQTLEGSGKANQESVSATFLADSPGTVLGRRGQPQKRGHTFPGLEGPVEPSIIRGGAVSITWKCLRSCRREGAGSQDCLARECWQLQREQMKRGAQLR